MKQPPPFPDTNTFASVLGQAVWLMTVSKAHRDLQINQIEELVTPAVLLQQFKMYFKEKQPIAFISWAAVSDEVKARFDAGDTKLAANEWRSGKNIVVVQCVSPFSEEKSVLEQFWNSATAQHEAN